MSELVRISASIRGKLMEGRKHNDRQNKDNEEKHTHTLVWSCTILCKKVFTSWPLPCLRYLKSNVVHCWQ